ncbi:MFS transporter [Brevibacillus humidisoli]|uniref:MFS transporter n=1 Tax=Brevibacillus humidisoli TaxID=2895522 RepID=UPI001E619230|nr:MFS transporter [Brevibacillus humidisoli]UFJ39372.1 MFS transporter [Brevibacillus humidisoli]
MHKKLLTLLFSVMFLMMLGFGIIIPILPFFAERIGADSLQIGILFASYNIMQFLFSPLWGSLSDRIGRKPLIVTGLIGFSITFVLFGLSDTYGEMLLYRILGGIVSAAAIPTVTAMVADLFPPDERAKGMGVIGAGVGLSFVFGPVIGGLLGDINASYPFFAAAGVAFLTMLFVLAMLPESLPRDNRAGRGGQRWINPLSAMSGRLALLYNLLFIVSFSFAGLEATFALYIGHLFGMTSKDLGYMFLVMGIIAAIVQGGLIGRMVKKWGESAVLSLGLGLYAVGFVLILIGQGFWSLSLYLSLFGAGQGMIRATATSLITRRTTQAQGVTSGTMSSMDSLGRILGPVVAGALFSWHYSAPYIAGAVLVGAILLLFLVRNRSLPEPTEIRKV